MLNVQRLFLCCTCGALEKRSFLLIDFSEDDVRIELELRFVCFGVDADEFELADVRDGLTLEEGRGRAHSLVPRSGTALGSGHRLDPIRHRPQPTVTFERIACKANDIFTLFC